MVQTRSNLVDVPLNSSNEQSGSSTNNNHNDHHTNPTPRLRPRLVKNEPKKTRGKKNQKALVVRQAPIRPEPCEYVEVGQVVLFKMRGHCEWPASVLSIDQNMVKVEFFGDHTTQKSVLGENILKLENSSELILSNLRNRKKNDYAKAIKELELVMRIPAELSIFNRI